VNIAGLRQRNQFTSRNELKILKKIVAREGGMQGRDFPLNEYEYKAFIEAVERYSAFIPLSLVLL
jgi:hypothetical protein